MTVVISKFSPGSGLSLMYPDINNELQTLEPPTTEDIDSYQFDMSGNIDRVFFATNTDRADVKKVCFYP